MGYNAMTEEEIKAAIIREGYRSFMTVGIAQTQMREIAKTVNISRSTLYLYFPSKADLVFHIARDLLSKMSEELAGLVEEARCPNAYEKVRLYLTAMAERFMKNPKAVHFLDEFDAIFTGEYPDVDEARLFSDAMAKPMHAFNAYIAEGQAEGSIRSDLPANMLGSVLVDGIYGIAQRILPRTAHIEREHDVATHPVIHLFIDIVTEFIKNK